jgi:hypothetical protein
MGTTAEKLNAVLDSKEAIRQAIEYRGVDIPMDTTLAEYADKIGEIPTGGTLTDEQALVFIGECANGKRKIAKAVRSKYETITNEESGITEYSTFDELSDKIKQIPIEVPLGSAMEQNGGVLPFYDVYNEALKAIASVGTEYKGVCAFELDKWSYDNDDKVTLSGADAYYTSDGTFIKDNIIYKNGSQIGELDNSLYQFQDVNAENTNRFVVYFFVNERYQVPKTLDATSCLNLWCIKGTPLMNFNADFTSLNSINVYDGELVVKGENDFRVRALTLLKKLNIPHIVEVAGGDSPFNSPYLISVSFPNLTTISGGTNFLNNNVKCRFINLPKLHKATKLIDWSYPSKTDIALGNGTKDGIAGDIKILISGSSNSAISTLTVAKGFKAKLNLTGCNGLSREVLVDIINNLADLTGTEYADKLVLTLGSTLYDRLKEDDRLIATNKDWQVIQ